ncbi:MAG: hypothetical protein GY927_20880 [bacterium]|nr:hypothetical protein [bacterium]
MNDIYTTQHFLQIDFDRAISARFVPAGKRRGMHLLCALDMELGKIRYQTSDPLLRRIRTQFWREALFETSGAGHKLASILIEHFSEQTVLFNKLENMICAFEKRQDEDFSLAKLFYDNCEQQVVLFDLYWTYLSTSDALVNTRFFQQCGLAYGGASLLATEKRQFQNNKRDMAMFYDQTQDAFTSIRADLSALDPSLRAAILPLALVAPYLDLFQRSDKALTQSIDLHPARKAWILWRAARKGFR